MIEISMLVVAIFSFLSGVFVMWINSEFKYNQLLYKFNDYIEITNELKKRKGDQQ